ncbi:Fe(3+)-hydroxamate ABC transporter permease FhuB [Pseudochelatococcus lubricantis]|uniref:Fe(3+)-hydroxamate ABC transporter permease FhuB n=1 Tax=Pseudochelatococcus lubricantis TaxID=1538102 RepID=UPI0035EFCB76
MADALMGERLAESLAENLARERRSARPWLFWGAMALLAAALFAARIVLHLSDPAFAAPPMQDIGRVILTHGLFPRAAVALVSGAALGLAGLLLQRVLRNPLAEPSTLGIAAGAQLAMAAATIAAPGLMAISREGVALAGGLGAAALILTLTWRRGLEPVSVVLAGMMTALTATAASTALILANGDYMFSLFIWGGGSLTQQDWGATTAIATRLVIVTAAAALLLRPLAILGLDDAASRSLGLAVDTMRLMVIALAVWLASTVTAQVGVIGFVGLAAPTLAHLGGARTLRARMVAAPLIGAILLWLTDGCIQLTAGSNGERIPTGAATALLGGPLLLWLLPRIRIAEWPSLHAALAAGARSERPWRLVAVIVVACLCMAAVGLAAGRGPDGWTIATGALFADLLTWRAPHMGIAAASGAMLAGAGMLLQRVTGNPLASPEILGVGTGAGVGLTAVLYLVDDPGIGIQFAASASGAVIVLVLMLAIAARSGFGPERLLLGGVAMGALCSAVLTAVIATGGVQALALLRWISGSVNMAAPEQALLAGLAALALLAPLPFMSRWLDILPLGAVTARALGVPVRRSHAALIALAGLLTATAALFVGPLSFIGLIAPHLARLIGLARPLPCMAGSVLIGAGLMMLSDWLSRMVAFPYQLPLGLFAALLGGPYLIWLLGRGRAGAGR